MIGFEPKWVAETTSAACAGRMGSFAAVVAHRPGAHVECIDQILERQVRIEMMSDPHAAANRQDGAARIELAMRQCEIGV